MDGLAAFVQEELKADPFSGIIYVFRAKRSDRVKLLFWDQTGLCLLSKRLEGTKFCWPAIADGVMRLSPAQLVYTLAVSCGPQLRNDPHVRLIVEWSSTPQVSDSCRHGAVPR